jgi:hypothetical protein
MFHRIHQKLGTAGLLIAVGALVLAMVGGAYAAGGLTAQQEKQVKKIAKKYAGKPGANGAPGAPGANGTNGKDGANGANGESVKLAAAGKCVEGGTKLTVGAEEAEVCNGEAGEAGENGETGFTEHLPPEKTETGTWGFGDIKTGEESQLAFAPITFNIPLATAIEASHALVVESTGNGAGNGCPGSSANPTAEKGFLCAYKQEGSPGFEAVIGLINPAEPFPHFGAAKTGALVAIALKKEKDGYGFGTWAVTAP